MKNLALLLLLFTGIVKAQTVTIPDANFKAKLIALGIDSNANGEIEVGEATAMVAQLDISNSNISNLTGLEAFVNLTMLNCGGNNITTLNIDSLSALQVLECDVNPITSINLSALPNLSFLGCANTLVTSLDFTANPVFTGLRALNCEQLINLDLSGHPNCFTDLDGTTHIRNLNMNGCVNSSNLNFLNSCTDLVNVDLTGITSLTNLQIASNSLSSLILTGCNNVTSIYAAGNFSTLDISDLTNLTFLAVRANLTSLDLSGLTQLNYLDCDNNHLTNLDLSMLFQLTEVHCIGNQLTSLDVSGLSNLDRLFCAQNLLTSLNVSNNPALTQLVCEGNQIQNLDVSLNTHLDLLSCGDTNLVSLNMKNGSNEQFFYFNDSPSLTFVCADDADIVTIQPLLNLHAPAVVLNSYCSFVPGGDYNKIVGSVKYDQDNNGCDSNDTIFPIDLRLDIESATMNGGTFYNQDGNYTFYTETGDYTITPRLEMPEYFNVSPPFATVNFPIIDNSTQTQNFCISNNGFHPDLEVIIVPLNRARPGFDVPYQLVYRNKGNQTLNGDVSLAFDDLRTDLISAVPSADSQTGNVLLWNFTNLNPFEVRTIHFTLNLNSPQEIPSLNNGDTLHFTGNISYAPSEGTPLDNTFNLSQVIVNSIDPNEKTCLEGNSITPDNIGRYLHYNITFENIGTEAATNIVVKDTIDTAKFDINTLQLIYASHAVHTKIRGNIVEFIFEGIELPPSSLNPIGGHGNVLFKIKTKDNLVVGDEVANTANIFFDYNAPIQTNEARTAFTLLNNPEFNTDTSVTVSPNPAKDHVNIHSKSKLRSIQLFDIQGRILQSISENKNTASIDISNNQKGVYFLKITTENGTKVEKIIKE